MSLIPKVKCSRCDHSYSGLKNRCPDCGAHRGRSGKRASDTGDAGARMMIRLLLLAAVIITVVSVLALDLDSDPLENAGLNNRPPSGTVQGQGNDGEEDGDGEEGEEGEAPPFVPTPAPTPTPVEVTSVDINWQFKGNFNEMTIRVGDTIPIWAEIFPTDADVDVDWSTSDSNTVNYRYTDPNNFREIEITGRSVGDARITVSAGDLYAVLIVRVR